MSERQTLDELVDAIGGHVRRINDLVDIMRMRGWRVRLDFGTATSAAMPGPLRADIIKEIR